jgi:DUF1365 family protein
MVTPGAAAVCPGVVHHRRARPTVHAIEHRVSYVWIDPDSPEELTNAHPMWSARRPAPARFRRTDYGARDTTAALGDQARSDVAALLGFRPGGPVRMLSQIRRWGWLFNPITVFVVWHDGDDPVGVVLEVTNTPWKERTRYALLLKPAENADGFVTTVAKAMHVSPFLDERYVYAVALSGGGVPDSLTLSIDVIDDVDRRGSEALGEPVLRTSLHVQRIPASRASLGAELRAVAPTHCVSALIHLHALRLLFKRVPFVAHPAKRKSP